MEEKRIKHYRCSHKILLVGEGDFSFSLCLAKAFGTAVNIVATSLDSRVSLVEKYGNALSNLIQLESLGCTILHQVDVHTMSRRIALRRRRYFDRIIFNFPHAGFIYREFDAAQIELHQELVSGFLRNAQKLLSVDGQIHITHKTAYPFSKWNIKKLGKREGLICIGRELFSKIFYPGYNNKRGDGFKCDESFPVGECSTFQFALPKIFLEKKV